MNVIQNVQKMLDNMNGWMGIRQESERKVIVTFAGPGMNKNGDCVLGICLEKGPVFCLNMRFKQKVHIDMTKNLNMSLKA